MMPGESSGTSFALIIITFIVIAVVLFLTLVGSSIAQHRRFLRARTQFAGRLLTAQDAERSAIARELHDDTVQRVIVSAMQLRAIDTAPALLVATDLDAIAEGLRTLARNIHPASLDHADLSASLAYLTRAAAEQHQIAIEFVTSGEARPLTPRASLALYRVAQEALTNLGRHSQAEAGCVELTHSASGTQLMISDSGIGFDTKRSERGVGIGVLSMQERLKLLGGTLSIRSSPGDGTAVTADLPGHFA